MNAKPGYWDVDRCAWVGTDPATLVPPMRHAEHPHERDIVALPEPRAESGEVPARA